MGLLASFRLEGAARSDRRPKNSGTRRVWRSWGCRFQLSVLVTGAAGWEAWLSRPGRGGCACPGTSRGVRRQRGSAGSARLGWLRWLRSPPASGAAPSARFARLGTSLQPLRSLVSRNRRPSPMPQTGLQFLVKVLWGLVASFCTKNLSYTVLGCV